MVLIVVAEIEVEIDVAVEIDADATVIVEIDKIIDIYNKLYTQKAYYNKQMLL